MLVVSKSAVAIYVDRVSRQWIVRDPEGQFWALPTGEDAWEQRQVFEPTPETDLEPIPGHYKYLLRLPF